MISIIMISAGILFPVFGKSRAQGRGTACLSNLKQIGTAYLSYSTEYGYTVKIWSSEHCRWMDSLSVYLNGTLPVCSEDRRVNRGTALSYGISGILSAGSSRKEKEAYPWYHIREKMIVNPSRFITVSGISDSYFLGDGTDSAAVTGFLNGESAVTEGFCKNLSFRHGSSALIFQAALADGHAEKFRFDKMPDRYWDLRDRGGYGGTK